MMAWLAELCLCVSVMTSPPDSTLIKARAALDAGRPWEATRIVAPLLADASRRTPEVVFVAATAASRWSGWREVGRLLENEVWLDSLFGVEGRRLMVRAALERGADSVAVDGARRGLRRAPDSTAAALLVLLAQGYERIGARDSAALMYQRAAARLPMVADWLFLRAIAVTDDSVRRTQLAARLTTPRLQSRVLSAMVMAREASGDLAGAAVEYALLGNKARALRLRLAAQAAGVGDTSATARATIRKDILAYLRTNPLNVELQEAVRTLDTAFAPLQPEEELVVAHAAKTLMASRAADGYARALAAGLGTSQDRFDYATVLFGLGRYSDAARQFKRVTQPQRLAAEAAYQHARALIRDDQLNDGRAELTRVAQHFAKDTAAASSALYLLADLATDRQDDAEARALFRKVATRYPEARFAARARFQAAILAFTLGRFDSAAVEFDEVVQRYPADPEVLPTMYWAGRTFAATGDTAAARVRWTSVLSRDSLSYYASLSARRLGLTPWGPAPAVDTFVVVPAIDSALRRAALLMHLGMATDALSEYSRIAEIGAASRNLEQLLAAADALRRSGRAFQSIQLAQRALNDKASRDARIYRLLYPIVHRDALVAEATEHGLDPYFVAALIRQESHFNPAATSPVGARGLMQLMPKVGAGLAQTRGYPVWDPVLLYQPDVSLQLGTMHLQELANRYDTRVRMLAAYNAGVSRVERWSQKPGAEDPELFAERIPYTETRNYVRIIQRNEELYRALYR